jgi:ribosomal protein S18 acetylase RimI-like enzyme
VLRDAISLARSAEVRLIVISSQQSTPSAVLRLAATGPPADVTVIDLPERYDHPLFKFSTNGNPMASAAKGDRASDLSLKRNIGLALARLTGWRKLFFLDDDIRGLTSNDLAYAVRSLDIYNCVAFSMHDFPDNSVVSHARRVLESGHQEVFISGAAMGVRCLPNTTFFPVIYNEDLFFSFDELAAGGVLYAGSVEQSPYDPFLDPARASSEEFGDLLIEGLLALLHEDFGRLHATRTFWSHFAELRAAHIEEVIYGISQRSEAPNRDSAIRSLVAARERLSEISADDCVDFLTAWHNDQIAWNQRASGMEKVMDLPDVLASLDLPFTALSHTEHRSTLIDGVVGKQTPTVALLSMDNWRLLRSVRLRALRDSPTAFAAELETEAEFDEDEWRSLLGQHRWFVVDSDIGTVGIAAVRPGADWPISCHIESMWVAPTVRGEGIAQYLMGQVMEKLRADGGRTVLLWVLDGNDRARSFYAKVGFTSTGERQQLTVGNRTEYEERFCRKINSA